MKKGVGVFFPPEAKSGTQLSQHFSASLHVSILHDIIILHPSKMYDEINQDFLDPMTVLTVKTSHVSSITDVLCHSQLKKRSQAHSYIHPPLLHNNNLQGLSVVFYVNWNILGNWRQHQEKWRGFGAMCIWRRNKKHILFDNILETSGHLQICLGFKKYPKSSAT